MKIRVEYPIDWQLLQAEILKGVRGKTTQKELDRKMGNGPDQCYRWENGLANIDWVDFLYFLQYCKTRVDFSFSNRLYQGPAGDWAQLIQFSKGPLSQQQFCQRVKLSRTNLNKWLSKKSTPPLIAILKILHHGHGQLISWLERLCPATVFASLGKLQFMQSKRNEVLREYPAAIFILEHMYTTQFEQLTYSPGYFSRHFQISLEDEHAIIQGLIESETIIPWKSSFAVVECFDFIIIDGKTQRSERDKFLYQLSFSQNRLRQSLSEVRNFHHAICCVSQRQKQEIARELQLAHQKILSIMQAVDADEIIDDAILVHLNMLSLIDPQLLPAQDSPRADLH